MFKQYPQVPWHTHALNHEIASNVYSAVAYMDRLSECERVTARQTHMRDLSVLAPLGDTDFVPSQLCEPYPDQPNVLRFKTAGTLAVAIEALDEHFRQPTAKTQKEYILQHVEDNMEMQRCLRFRGIGRALVITDTTENHITWQAMALGTPRNSVTKLRYTASVVGAREASDEEIEQLHTVGYKGLEDLIRRIREYNVSPAMWADRPVSDDRWSPFIPLPLSQRRQYQSWRQQATDDWAEERPWEKVARREDSMAA